MTAIKQCCLPKSVFSILLPNIYVRVSDTCADCDASHEVGSGGGGRQTVKSATRTNERIQVYVKLTTKLAFASYFARYYYIWYSRLYLIYLCMKCNSIPFSSSGVIK